MNWWITPIVAASIFFLYLLCDAVARYEARKWVELFNRLWSE